jgi:hypothetical protein
MANGPSPVVTISGVARSSSVFDLQADRDTGVVRQAHRVLVLTERGGFGEVYLGPQHTEYVPEDFPADVCWDVEVSAWNRKTRDGSRNYADLSVKFVGVHDAEAGAGSARPYLASAAASSS